MEGRPEPRIVGGAPAEKKEEAKAELERAFSDHFASLTPEEQKKAEKFELPKTEKETSLINFANAETNRLMQASSAVPYDLPKGNYHVLHPADYQKLFETPTWGRANYTKQGAFLNADAVRSNPVVFGEVAIHETLHLKGHAAFKVEGEEKVEKTVYRGGVKAVGSDKTTGKRHRHFEGLNEAIVSAQTKRSLARLLELPELAAEKAWLESPEAAETRRKLANDKKLPEDEFFWVGRDEQDWRGHSNFYQRETLNYVLGEIQKQFSDRFQSTDEVFDEFLKAHFTGHLLGIAHLVGGTFGKDSFRELGNMIDEDNSAILVQESLRRMRARQIKQRES